MTLRVRRIRDGATVPSYAHEGDAGMDLCAAEDVVVKRGSRALVPTGLVFMLPPGYEAQVRPRSGLALKRGVTVLNSPGTVDSGYRGEVGVILANFGEDDFEVKRGDRIAQVVVAPVEKVVVAECEETDSTERGAGGFGSTGV
jgi:dUTP pyrophosphatase